MELNEVTRKLPPHLMQFVVDQPYDAYTPVDQAVWRYVMRQNKYHLKKVAHESYIEGLRKTGVEADRIPTMYGMNRILKEIGWAAVAVDGFIPPAAFMEFTKYNVLVIAEDIRTLEHIEYTPAPDIIHESAGHAPIIAVPEFAQYLKYIGEVGSKAFSSTEDFELYEAIRHLSIIKEDPNTPDADIHEAEEEIARIQSSMGPPSEMAMIRNLHWWTVEYGLIGTVSDFKIYGAGLLSSIGESMSCLRPGVRKIPYTIDAAHCNYDITKPQPQLFVTPNFAHLTNVLNEFRATMAWDRGGIEGMRKAIASKQTGTCVYSSGLQVSGTFRDVVTHEGEPVFLATQGPSALACGDNELEGFGKLRFPNGFMSPVGRIKGFDVLPEDLSHDDIRRLETENGGAVHFEFPAGFTVDGVLAGTLRSVSGKLLALVLQNGSLARRGETWLSARDFVLGIGHRVVSAFQGPADSEAFQPVPLVPKEKMHKIEYNEEARLLHSLYQRVREIRESWSNSGLMELTGIWKRIERDFPGDWLLPLEILEMLEKEKAAPALAGEIMEFLTGKREREPHLQNLISNGLELIHSATPAPHRVSTQA